MPDACEVATLDVEMQRSVTTDCPLLCYRPNLLKGKTRVFDCSRGSGELGP